MGYPNPAHYEILFTMEAGEKAVLDYNYSYELRDKTGNLIKAGITNRNSIVIDVRDIPRDTYLFEVRIGKQLIQQRILLN